ncbi:MAG: GGDEF domain-containing protein [Nitrospirota bacterium]
MAVSKYRVKEMLQPVQKLNNSLQDFIRGSIESSLEIENWNNLSDEFAPVWCREIRGCRKKKCPAYSSHDYRCWLQVGTLSNGNMQCRPPKRYNTCFDCEVFSAISKEPVRALYENINTILFHFKNKAIKLRELAIKDNLTGLYNRHFFNEIIEREVSRVEREKNVVSFIMIDLDYLKQINDTLGHLTGDKILVEVANMISSNVRKSDIVFRFGGDEFLVVLVNADCLRTGRMVRRLLDSNNRWNKENAKKIGCRISFSIGCATCDKCANILETLNEADANMYINKKKRKYELEGVLL